jgi:hypothetical protein
MRDRAAEDQTGADADQKPLEHAAKVRSALPHIQSDDRTEAAPAFSTTIGIASANETQEDLAVLQKLRQGELLERWAEIDPNLGSRQPVFAPGDVIGHCSTDDDPDTQFF